MDSGANNYRRFLQGDDEGFADVVREYKDGLILYLNSYVNNTHIAEEITEDTFFRLLIRKPHFSGKSTFKTWLYSIGRNMAIDWLRRESKHVNIPDEDMEAYLKDETDLESAYIKEEQKQTLYRVISRLLPDYRSALWLVCIDGFTSEEAGIILKKSSRQMKNLLYRAKKSLKDELEKEGFIYEEF